MNGARTLATALRVLKQLRHDHRTVGLVLFMPSVLLIVLRFVFDAKVAIFNNLAPLLLGIFPFILMFIVSSVAVLRERTSGTLERLLSSPASKLDILFGYAAAFTLIALVQASLTSVVLLGVLKVDLSGATPALLLFAVLSGVLGMAFGLLFSAFAKNEFQAVQFMPAFVFPQLLICGLFTSRDTMAQFLQYISDVMPLTYIVDALKAVKDNATWTGEMSRDLAVVAGFVVFSLLLGSISLRSQ